MSRRGRTRVLSLPPVLPRAQGSATVTAVGRAFAVSTGVSAGVAVVSGVVQGDITLAWDAVSGATSYRVEIGTTEGASNVLDTDVGNVTSYVPTLSAGNYFARVRTVISGVEQDASHEIYFTV